MFSIKYMYENMRKFTISETAQPKVQKKIKEYWASLILNKKTQKKIIFKFPQKTENSRNEKKIRMRKDFYCVL